MIIPHAKPGSSSTTIDARKALGPETRIVAIDIMPPSKSLTKKLDKRSRIETLQHSIANEPLPFLCDALRFANVSHHMAQSERRRAVVNCWKSLKLGGYLLGADRRDGYDIQFILRKTRRGFDVLESYNMISGLKTIPRFFKNH